MMALLVQISYHSMIAVSSVVLVFWLCMIGVEVEATPPGFPASLKPGCLPKDANNTDLFCPGDLGYGCFKIPTVMQTRKGTLLAMIEARKHSCDDHGYVDLLLRRSFDNGKTWQPSQLMYSNSTDSPAPRWTTVGDGNWVEDANTGTIWLLHTRNNSRLFLSHSDDDGATWTAPIDVSSLRHGGGAGTGHDCR
jgi:sialidase-1